MLLGACSSSDPSTVSTVGTSPTTTSAAGSLPPDATTQETGAPSTTGEPVAVSGTLFEALLSTPLPAEGLPDYSTLLLEFDLDFEQPTETGGTLRFFASPSAGTSAIILYQLAPEPSFEGVPASSMVSAAAGEAEIESQTTPSIAGADDAACGTWTELLPTGIEGLPTAVCFALVGESLVLTSSTLLLFEVGGSNESMATDLMGYAVDHLLTLGAATS
jgi:hypothetical protein